MKDAILTGIIEARPEDMFLLYKVICNRHFDVSPYKNHALNMVFCFQIDVNI